MKNPQPKPLPGLRILHEKQKRALFQPIQPLLNLRATCMHFVPIDAELTRDLGLWESSLHIFIILIDIHQREWQR